MGTTPPAPNQVRNNESQALLDDQVLAKSRKAAPVNQHLSNSSQMTLVIHLLTKHLFARIEENCG
jgi:hypothetical protein